MGYPDILDTLFIHFRSESDRHTYIQQCPSIEFITVVLNLNVHAFRISREYLLYKSDYLRKIMINLHKHDKTILISQIKETFVRQFSF